MKVSVNLQRETGYRERKQETTGMQCSGGSSDLNCREIPSEEGDNECGEAEAGNAGDNHAERAAIDRDYDPLAVG